MEDCEKSLRSDYQVHFMVPGKKQEGPVSMVAKSYREALPALAWLFEQLIIDGPIPGRIHRNVKDPRIGILDGTFLPGAPLDGVFLPYWLFQSPQVSILACSLVSDSQVEGSTIVAPAVNTRAMALQTCLDNVVFRLGKEAIGRLDIFTDPYNENSFAAGDPNQAEVLRREISTAFKQQFMPPNEGENASD
jgi:hypothetical protein